CRGWRQRRSWLVRCRRLQAGRAGGGEGRCPAVRCRNAGQGGIAMLSSIVGWTLLRPRLVIAAALLLLIYGGVVLSRAKFDVFPDFVPAQAEVQTEAPGFTAAQVEQLVTRPIEQSVNGASGVDAVRSESQA